MNIKINPEHRKGWDIKKNLNQPQKTGSIKKIKGLKLFSFNFKTGELKEVEEKITESFDENNCKTITRRIEQDIDCIYLQALNLKNAKRKLKID